MKKTIIRWEVYGFLAIFLVGSAWHFFYSATGISLIGLIAPVNESVWEHFKLGTHPFLIFSLIMYFYLKERPINFWVAQVAGLYSIPIIMSGLFYLYTAFTGRNILPIDISIFAIYVVIAQWLSYKILMGQFKLKSSSSTVVSMIVILINETYGISQIK